MIQDKLASSEWVYENIFNLNEEEMDRMRWGIVNDQKRAFRYEQISMEGNDPIKSGLSFGTPHDLMVGQTDSREDIAQQKFGEDTEGGAPEEGFEGAGRPKENPHYGKDGSARGRDPLGKVGMRKEELQKTLKNLGLKKNLDKKIIQETLETEDEYNNYLNKEKAGEES